MLPSQVIYATEKRLDATYKYLDLYLNQNSTNSLLSQNANGILGEIRLPADTVFNLSRSYLEFRRRVPNPVAGGGTFIWSPDDVIADFEQISLSNAANVYICNHQNAALHNKVARPLSTKPDVNYFKKISGDNLYPCNEPRNKTTLTVTGGTAVFSGELISGEAVAAAATSTKNYNVRAPAVDTDTNLSYKLFNIEKNPIYNGSIISQLEPKHLIVSSGAANAAGDLVTDKRIPLSAYKDTIFELDKDLVFPNEMYLRFKTAPAKNVVFISDSGINPTTAGAGPYVGNIEYNGVVLRLALQNTNDLIDLVKSAYNAGKLKLTIPWVENRFNSLEVAAGLNNTNTMNYKVSFNSQFGKRLRQCMLTLINTDYANGGNIIFDNHNWNGEKCIQLQTFFNDKKNFEENLNCAFSDANGIKSHDWNHNQMFCDNSLYFNEPVYKLNWFHIDKWSSNKEDDPNKEEGLILGDKDDTYGIQIKLNGRALTAKKVTAHIFLTFLRELTISPNLPNRIELL